MIYRFLDIFFAIFGITLLMPLFLLVYFFSLFDTGRPLFIQDRMGAYKKPFRLVKFRTMYLDTESIASHLADKSQITPLGKILRKTKLDELPQLFNVLVGDMSLVGPRPNLLDQTELINKRDAKGIYNFKPGITGLAQINKIDMSKPDLLAEKDLIMVQNMSLYNYFSLIIKTVFGAGSGDIIK